MCRLRANFGRLAHSMQNARKWEAGRKSRNAGSFLRKELGEALRTGQKLRRNTIYSHQAPLGPRIFCEKPAILRRFQRQGL